MNNTKQQDMDRDGVGDICDNCVVYRNPDQMNSDNDQTGDECDDDDDNDGISKFYKQIFHNGDCVISVYNIACR